MTTVPQGINEDLVIWIETTGGKMRLYPEDGTWTVDKRDEETDKVTAIVLGFPDFDSALTAAIRSVCNPATMLDNSLTLKGRVLVEDGLEEYRAKAVVNADQN